MAADSTGFSDPYIKVNFFGSEWRSPIKIQTCNPVWNIRAYIKVRTINLIDPPPIVITLYDWDKYDSDDYIGCCILDFDTWLGNGAI